MSFFSMGKRVKNQRFNYIPKHYDPAKEDLENRLRMLTDEQNPEMAKMRIRSGFKRKARGNKELATKLRRNANIRLMAIIAFLMVVTYFLMKSEAILQFIERMSS